MLMYYDRDSDTLDVLIAASRDRYWGTRELSEGVYLDLDERGNPLALEILGASRRYPAERLSAVAGDKVWMSLREAAESVGLSPETLRVQVNAGRLRASKKAGIWLTTPEWFQEYLASRRYNAKPAQGGAAAAKRGVAERVAVREQRQGAGDRRRR